MMRRLFLVVGCCGNFEAIRKYSKKTQDAIVESQVIVEETLQGISNVKAFPRTRYRNCALVWQKTSPDSKNCNQSYGQILCFVPSSLSVCLIVAVVWYGVTLVISGDIKEVGEPFRLSLLYFRRRSFAWLPELYVIRPKSTGATERGSNYWGKHQKTSNGIIIPENCAVRSRLKCRF
jgi:hypothetical protein